MGTDECDWSETQSMSRPGVEDLSVVLSTPERNSCSCSKKVISWFFSFNGCNKLVVRVFFQRGQQKSYLVSWTY
jgi:hypothetical protein